MIIGIDISSIPYGTGVSNYTLNLVRNLIKIDKDNTYKLFYSSLRLPLPSEIKLLGKYSHVKIYHYRLPLTFLHWLWNWLYIYPIELFIGKCDVFHTSDWTQPPTIKAKTITTIHDLVPFLFPNWSNKKIIVTHFLKISQALKHCSSFICVSQNTRCDFKKLFPSISDQKISVIYEAAEDKYEKFGHLPLSIRQQKINQIKKIYDLDKYILAQGTREPRKNLARLIEGFLLFKQKYPTSKYVLAIAGKYGWGKDIPPQNHLIKILGFIPEKDMVALNAASVCLAYPSLYEGFGLPLIKAMKLGLPIITSNCSVMPEIVGNSAILVDPKNPKDIGQALEKIYKSSSLRQTLSQKGLLRSKKFSWFITAKQTLNIYENIYAHRN
jgi:glycosyltransferase involved in cell wall biosynthesis